MSPVADGTVSVYILNVMQGYRFQVEPRTVVSAVCLQCKLIQLCRSEVWMDKDVVR